MIKITLQKIIFFIAFIIFAIYILLPQKEDFSNLTISQVEKDYPQSSFISVGDKYKQKYNNEYCFLYGELTFDGMQSLFNKAKELNLPTNMLIDLGCGNGRALFYAILAGFDNAKGVELAEERIEYGKNVLKDKDDDTKNRINIELKDIFELDKSYFGGCKVIYISNLVFPENTNQKLFDFLKDKIEKGTVIFSSSTPANMSGYTFLGSIRAPMSWEKQSELFISKFD